MKRFVKSIALLLLLLNGIGAIYGGMSLVLYPDGSRIHLSPELLKYSFFDDYFIPGLILLTANGLLSLYALIAIVVSLKKYWEPVVLQGVILIGWLIIQMALIHMVHYSQLVIFAIGIALILAGIELFGIDHQNTPGEKF